MTQKQKKTPKQGKEFVPPQNMQMAGTSEWLYDEIMRFIEPDLTLAGMQNLSAKYAQQTEEEQMQRMKAYEISFRMFDDAYEQVAEMLVDGVHHVKEEAKKRMQTHEKAEKTRDLADLESQFDQYA